MQYWLMKSEPDTYSIDDLREFGTDHWDGIRNYQVRNFFRDQMKVGDKAFFYPDHTAFDKTEKYFDPKSDPDNPRWLMLDVQYMRHLKRKITLTELRGETFLESMRLLQKGNRLSVLPITKNEWEHILSMEKR